MASGRGNSGDKGMQWPTMKLSLVYLIPFSVIQRVHRIGQTKPVTGKDADLYPYDNADYSTLL